MRVGQLLCVIVMSGVLGSGIATAIAAPETAAEAATPGAAPLPAATPGEVPPPAATPRAAPPEAAANALAKAVALRQAAALEQAQLESARAKVVQLEKALEDYAALKGSIEQQMETSKGVDTVITSVTGLTDSSAPEWSLLADAAVTSIDFSKPTLSLGLERATPWWLAMVAFKKNAADNSVNGTRGDPAFGRAVLSPALANFSVAAHLEWRPWAYLQCNTDCRSPQREINTKGSKGFYASVEASYAKLTDTSAMRPDGSAVSGYFSPLAVSAGFVYRLEGAMPEGFKLGTRKLGLTGYAGLAARVISGDLGNADRTTIFGTADRYYAGFELGATVQLGNVLVDPRVVGLTNDRSHIPGLTGLQVQVNLSFVLPWSVLGGN